MLHKLIAKIEALPALTLSEAEMDDFSYIMGLLTDDNLEALQLAFAKYAKDITLKSTTISKMIDYMRAYFDMGDQLVILNKILATIWFNITAKPMTEDDSLPLMIAILPENLTQLKMLQEKINHTAMLVDRGAYANRLINFSSALTAKMEDNTEVDDIVLIVANEVINIELKELTVTWNDFKLFLLDRLIEKLKALDNNTYIQFFINDTATEDVKENIMNVLLDESNGFLTIKDDSFSILKQKYLIISDMCYTLSRDVDNKEKMQKFSVKYLHQEPFLQAHTLKNSMTFTDKTSNYLGIKKIGQILQKEASYLEIGGLFSHAWDKNNVEEVIEFIELELELDENIVPDGVKLSQ